MVFESKPKTDEGTNVPEGFSFSPNGGNGYLNRFFPELQTEFDSIYYDLGLDEETLSLMIDCLRRNTTFSNKQEEKRFNQAASDIYDGLYREDKRPIDPSRYIPANTLYERLFIQTAVKYGVGNVHHNPLEDSQAGYTNKYRIIRQIAIGLIEKINSGEYTEEDKKRLNKWLDQLREFGGGKNEAERILNLIS